MPARSPIRRRVRSSRPSTRPRPTCRTALGRHKGYEYARTQNPTRAALEANVAALEGGAQGFAFASGMAAIGAVASLLQAGEHAVVGDNTYGGTFRLFEKVLRRQGITATYVDTSDVDAVAAAIQPTTRLLLLETPTNPMMTLTDLAAAADVAHRRNVAVVVDNTFASPALQRPLAFGCDLVLHSTTKYLNGHSDSIGGIVVATRDDHREWLSFYQNAYGAILSPFDSWLVLRGTKTLALRMAQHSANGLALATFLAGHPKVTRVLYPGTPRPSAARAGQGADERLRRHAGLRHGLDRRGAPGGRARADLRARRKPRRRRVAHRPPRLDDARLGAAGAARRARPHRRPGPDLGRASKTSPT